jgi:hypothetical protein
MVFLIDRYLPDEKLRTKINTSIEKCPIPGIEVGQRSQNRIQLSELKVQDPPGKKQKITTDKLISVILVQDVSVFYSILQV